MKVKSFKHLETYIYSSLVLPLKGLNLPDIPYPSPLTDANGVRWELELRRESVTREYRRNFQRDQAGRRRGWYVTLRTRDNDRMMALAHYEIRHHNVKIWERPFKEINAMPLFGKLYEAFELNTPFNRITVDKTSNPPALGYGLETYQRPRGLRMPFSVPQEETDYDQEYDADDDYDPDVPF